MGTDTSVVNESGVGIITEAGDAEFIDSSGIQYVGTVVTTGNSVSAYIQGFPPLGGTFADGSTHGAGTVTGTVTARQSFNGNTTFITDKGTTYTGTLTLTFDTLYNVPSSLSTIAGNYTDSATGDVVTIGSNGTIFSQSPATGCVVDGTVTVINPSYNAYEFQLSYSNCEGTYAVLNGLTVTGLGTFDNATSPVEVIGSGTGSVGGVSYGITYVLDQS